MIIILDNRGVLFYPGTLCNMQCEIYIIRYMQCAVHMIDDKRMGQNVTHSEKKSSGTYPKINK